MISVRDYFKNKEKREKTVPRISYREKIKSHKFTIFYRSVLIFAAYGGISSGSVHTVEK